MNNCCSLLDKSGVEVWWVLNCREDLLCFADVKYIIPSTTFSCDAGINHTKAVQQ